jgi:Zn-dependent M28 family amino/carboxypeptidase
VVSTEHFNRIARLLEREVPVTMTVDVQTTFHAEDLMGYNVVAELSGGDLAQEVVMLGGHFDSWHPATGATDNAGSCAVMMEAMRILKALDARPRRTIRVALWTGEEQGLLGSRGYVEQHFGQRETMELAPEHATFSCYLNLDNGCGKIRGIYLQENAAVRPIFADWLAPFADLDATTITIRNTGGTDHQSFDGVGLPGFQFIQDPMDYSTRSHHTNMDTYERVHESDVQQSAVIIASLAYHAAMRDEKLPRKALPEPRGQGRGGRSGAPVEAAAGR